MQVAEAQSPPPRGWRVTRASKTGTSHVARNIGCQDASLHAVMGEVCVIAVADGVGSAPLSDLGAQTAVKAAVEFLANSEKSQTAEAWEQTLRQAGKQALKAVQEAARARGQELRALASTLLLAVLTEEWTAALQIGDGAIVALFGPSELRSLTIPKKGEFANEVLPLTSRGALETAQVIVLQQRVTALAAFTDGLESLALTLPSGEPFPKFFLPLFDLASRVSEHDLKEEIQTLFEKRVQQRSDDDLTLAVAVHGATPTNINPDKKEAAQPTREERAAAAQQETDTSPPRLQTASRTDLRQSSHREPGQQAAQVKPGTWPQPHTTLRRQAEPPPHSKDNQSPPNASRPPKWTDPRSPSPSKKFLVVTGPALLIVALTVFGLVLWGFPQKPSQPPASPSSGTSSLLSSPAARGKTTPR